MIGQGNHVRIRTATGSWLPAIAQSGVRVDVENAPRRSRRNAWPTVSVIVQGWDHPVNWPAEDVEHA